MPEKFSFKKVQADGVWDDFIRKSAQGTIFSESLYLNSIGARYSCYFVYNKNELRAAVAITESEDPSISELDDFIIYNGLIYGRPTTGKNQAQQISEKFRINEFVAEEMAKIYQKLEVSLHPNVTDIRPFLWVNYGEPLPKYQANVRYTSYLKIDNIRSEKAFASASSARRQEIRYARRDNIRTSEESDASKFCDLYAMTMERQGRDVPIDRMEKMKRLIVTLRGAGRGKVYAARTAEEEIGSMAFFVWDHQRAYYLFGANDPAMRSQHTGTAVLWDAFHDLSEHGVREVDLEGVNSPRRGWFKLSFGGNLLPYYELTWRT